MQRTDLSKASGPTTTTHVSREKKTSNAEFLLRIVSAAASPRIIMQNRKQFTPSLNLSLSLSLESRISNLAAILCNATILRTCELRGEDVDELKLFEICRHHAASAKIMLPIIEKNQ